MRPELELLVSHSPNGRSLARFSTIGEHLARRSDEAKLDPNDFDLNPHLQVQAVADMVVCDVVAEGFSECTREEVYLFWLTNRIFHGDQPLRF